MSEVKAVCSVSDVIVAVLGLDSSVEGEEGDTGNEFASGDKLDLKFPGLQSEILRAAYESGKPVILVSMTGSAMELDWEDSHIPAIIQAWYPGAAGGRAVAELIFGAYSPEGKLPVTFYRTTQELPDFTDYAMKDRTYRYMKQEALYPFGFGLSYTSFEMKGTEADSDRVTAKGEVTIRTSIKNTGVMESGETIQVYVKALREGTPNAQLKGLKKVHLQPGEEKQVEITLKSQAFGLYNVEGEFLVEKGEYAVYVGMQQPDARSATLTGRETVCLKVMAEETFRL